MPLKNPQLGSDYIPGQNYQHGYVPSSSSDEDITAGLFDNLKFQAQRASNTENTSAAQTNYLQWLLTQNQRQFDTEWRDNERAYTSPEQQIQRLMDAGMSYSAALAVLQGSGDAGSASGLSPMTSVKPEPSKDIANNLGIANAVTGTLFNGITSALGFVQSFRLNGEQINLLRSQTTGQNLLNEMSSRTLTGQIDADGVARTIDYAIASGNWLPQESDYATSQSFLKAAYNSGVITDSQLASVYSSAAASDAFSDHFNKTWSTQGVKVSESMYDDGYAALRASFLAQQLSYDVTQQELDNARQSFQNLKAEQQNTETDTAYKNSLIFLTNQKTAESRAQTKALQNENIINQPTVDAYRDMAKEVTQAGRCKLKMMLARWSAYAGNEDKLRKIIDQDFENGVIEKELAFQMLSFRYQSFEALTDVTSNYSREEMAEFELAREFAKYYDSHLIRYIEQEQKAASTGVNVGVGSSGTGAGANLGVSTNGTNRVERLEFWPENR